MGGANTEVDENTKNIILECASFDMNQTRRTAMAYGLFTDAATRFTKNQSPRQNLAVLAKTAHDTLDLAGGRVASPMIDDRHFKIDEKPIKLSAAFVNSRLGSDLSAFAMKKILENVEFGVEIKDDKFSVTVPFWRTDIEIPEDIVEEIGRLHGYDKLPIVLPKRGLTPAAKDPALEFKARLRDILKRAGANEVLTYSFVHERLLKAAGHDPDEAFHIRNAVSPDLQYYRVSLASSLLDKVHQNRKNGYDNFALYEIGKVHIKTFVDKDNMPLEMDSLAIVTVSPLVKGAAYFQARKIADYLFENLNIQDLTFVPLANVEPRIKSSWYNNFDPNRSAVVWGMDHALGVIGEPIQMLKTALKLPNGTAMLEFDINNLYECQSYFDYLELNRFPASSQDICLKAPANLRYDELEDFIWEQLDKIAKAKNYRYEIEPIDIFQRPDDKDHRQTTWHISLWHPDKTLTTENVNEVLTVIAQKAKKELNAERI
jgi:phenylalanyl-tRNA synthetase beta chain